MKRKLNRFTDNEKYQAVQDYLTTCQSQAEVMKKYGIRGNSCISSWIRKFGLEKPDQKQIDIQNIMKKATRKSSREEALEVQIKLLEKDLAYEKLRTEALSTMIDIAEQDLKISIRKKSGTKQ